MLTNLCEIRNLCEMSDCSEGNSVLLYLDNRVGKPPTDWCQSVGDVKAWSSSLPLITRDICNVNRLG